MDSTCSVSATHDMQAPKKRRKKRGKLYFSSTKALKTSRKGEKKVAPESYERDGIIKVLDFEDLGENETLSTVVEAEALSEGGGAQSQGASKEMEEQSNPPYNPTSEEQIAEEDFEETSLMESKGGFHKS